MKKPRLWIVLAVLATAALACNALSGIGKAPTSTPVPADSSVTEPNQGDSDNGSAGTNSYDTEFPLPDDVSNFMKLDGGLITFQTKMSLDDLLVFYQDALSKKGYKERKLLTVTSDTTFNLVFDGHESGKAIVIQCVSLGDLADGKVNVTISLQKLD
jgi:hypothetical protein